MNSLLKQIKAFLPPPPYGRQQLGLVLLPVLIAVVLLLLDRYGIQARFYQYFSSSINGSGLTENQAEFYAQCYLTTACLLLFVLLPLVYHFLFPVEFSNPLGLRVGHSFSHWPVYLALILFMLPLLWLAASSPSFHHFYPMYRPIAISGLLAYELVYIVQFFATEFFFRGFCLFRLERSFGLYAVPLMVTPYALIHIHKPFPEALGSIIAGLVLGMLAIKTRSIWPGFVVHVTIAVTMDLFALTHAGQWSVIN